jgi:hypothetical protein
LSIRTQLHHRGDEPIASFRHGRDVPLGIRTLTERFADRENVVGEIRFFDDGVRPDGLNQLFLCKQTAGVRRQINEQIERLRGERHGLPVLQQDMFVRDERHRTELKSRRRLFHAGNDAPASPVEASAPEPSAEGALFKRPSQQKTNRNPSRLQWLVLASVSVLQAAVVRLVRLAPSIALADRVFLGAVAVDLLLLAVVLIDRRSTGRVHAVWLLGGAGLISIQYLRVAVVPTEFWRDVTQ